MLDAPNGFASLYANPVFSGLTTLLIGIRAMLTLTPLYFLGRAVGLIRTGPASLGDALPANANALTAHILEQANPVKHAPSCDHSESTIPAIPDFLSQCRTATVDRK